MPSEDLLIWLRLYQKSQYLDQPSNNQARFEESSFAEQSVRVDKIEKAASAEQKFSETVRLIDTVMEICKADLIPFQQIRSRILTHEKGLPAKTNRLEPILEQHGVRIFEKQVDLKASKEQSL